MPSKMRTDQGDNMFGRFRANYEEQLRLEKERLNNMSEKELLVELILEMKKAKNLCRIC